jgi:MgsA AAA+ ATPase C terminal
MANRFAEQTTPGGHRCDELASALQKAVRRGEEREALYWASELDLAGFANYAWKRLLVISSEDVGLASTETVLAVRALRENWLEMRKAVKPPYEGFVRVFLLHAVCLLARAPKSRMLDHALIAMYAGERPQIEVPDYALDRHTARGRRMGRVMSTSSTSALSSRTRPGSTTRTRTRRGRRCFGSTSGGGRRASSSSSERIPGHRPLSCNLDSYGEGRRAASEAV